MRSQESIYTPGPNTIDLQTLYIVYGGGVPLSPLLDGAAEFLSFLGGVPLLPLNTPAILPKKVFFLRASSSDWTPVAAGGFPFVFVGGSAFSGIFPHYRSENPIH